MKLFTRSTKIAGSLAAALMLSAPLALAATPTFAATAHDNANHDGDRDNHRSDYRGDHGVKHVKIAFHRHDKRFGHWGYAHGKRMWIVMFHPR